MKPTDWKDLAIDLAIIASITVLCALGIADRTFYLMIVGPLAGAKAVQRAVRRKEGTDDGPMSGSAALLLFTGAWALLRRIGPAALALVFVGVAASAAPFGCGLFSPAETPRVANCVERYVACVEAFPPGPDHRAEYDACASRVDAECLRHGGGGAGGGR